jgi:hypothetical protein
LKLDLGKIHADSKKEITKEKKIKSSELFLNPTIMIRPVYIDSEVKVEKKKEKKVASRPRLIVDFADQD